MAKSLSRTQLLELQAKQQAALSALQIEIAKLGNDAAVPAVLIASESELLAALEHTTIALQSYEVEASVGQVVVHNQASNQGAIGTFHGAVTIHNSASGKNPWSCYKCSTDNQPYTNFCVNCKAQLLRKCPECKENTSLMSTKICGKCGYHYDVAVERELLRGKIEYQRAELQKAQQEYNDKTEIDYMYPSSCSGAIMVFVFIGMLSFLPSAFIAAETARILGLDREATEYIMYFTTIPCFFVIILVLRWLLLKYRDYKLRKGKKFLPKMDQLRQEISQNQQQLDATDIG